MQKVLVSTGEVESMIREMYLEQYGSCFSSTVINFMATLVNSYNRTESANLVEDVIESLADNRPSDYSPVEDIKDHFIRLVETGADTKVCIVDLEYYPQDETLILTSRPRPVPKPSTRIKDEYHHAQAQGDFYPERLRRAFEDLISSGI